MSRNEQEPLVSPKVRDLSLISNLATTYTHWGLLERKAGDLKLALSKFQQGAKRDEELARNEPGNPNFEEYLARNYSYIADILEQMKRPDDALVYYQKLFEARRTLRLSRAWTSRSAGEVRGGREAVWRPLERTRSNRRLSLGGANLEAAGREPYGPELCGEEV